MNKKLWNADAFPGTPPPPRSLGGASRIDRGGASGREAASGGLADAMRALRAERDFGAL